MFPAARGNSLKEPIFRSGEPPPARGICAIPPKDRSVRDMFAGPERTARTLARCTAHFPRGVLCWSAMAAGKIQKSGEIARRRRPSDAILIPVSPPRRATTRVRATHSAASTPPLILHGPGGGEASGGRPIGSADAEASWGAGLRRSVNAPHARDLLRHAKRSAKDPWAAMRFTERAGRPCSGPEKVRTQTRSRAPKVFGVVANDARRWLICPLIVHGSLRKLAMIAFVRRSRVAFTSSLSSDRAGSREKRTQRCQ